jgi:hypothetical protein
MGKRPREISDANDDKTMHLLNGLKRIIVSLQNISTYWDEKVREGIARINEAAEEASEPGWDGYGALPVNDDSRRLAYKFMKIIPESYPLPDVAVDPDGDVSFDWNNESKESFAVSVSGEGMLSFAGLFRRGKVHGSEEFSGEIPKPILLYLERFIG